MVAHTTPLMVYSRNQMGRQPLYAGTSWQTCIEITEEGQSMKRVCACTKQCVTISSWTDQLRTWWEGRPGMWYSVSPTDVVIGQRSRAAVALLHSTLWQVLVLQGVKITVTSLSFHECGTMCRPLQPIFGLRNYVWQHLSFIMSFQHLHFYSRIQLYSNSALCRFEPRITRYSKHLE